MGHQIEDGRARTTISVSDLLAHGICEDQLALFRATFGDGPVAVTEANMVRAADVGLHIEWLECLLTTPAWAEYKVATAPARESYKVACDRALAAYEAVRASAWVVFKAARDQAWAEYEAARDQAWELYEAARDQAWTVYRRALVGPLVRALRAEGAT